jgi:hypothetical protein
MTKINSPVHNVREPHMFRHGNEEKGLERRTVFVAQEIADQNIPKHDGIATIVADINPALHLQYAVKRLFVYATNIHRRTYC